MEFVVISNGRIKFQLRIVSMLCRIPILDFPACVIGDQPELTAESLEIGDSQLYCWRNVFSCINLLRILNKLTKWKHSRIMVRSRIKPTIFQEIRVRGGPRPDNFFICLYYLERVIVTPTIDGVHLRFLLSAFFPCMRKLICSAHGA